MALGLGAMVITGAAAAQTPAAPAQAAPRCEVAVVNPVSGFAECVKPRGVPVAAPPPHPAPTPQQCAAHPDLDLPDCGAVAAEKPPPR